MNVHKEQSLSTKQTLSNQNLSRILNKKYAICQVFLVGFAANNKIMKHINYFVLIT